jgi:uncharacterized protein
MRPMYNDGARQLQDHFDSRRIADRLEQVTVHHEFTESDRAFIESKSMFFLGTADAEGWPDVSYKGGVPGFVRVLDPRTLVWADYDGNGMFRSLGNVLVNPRVQLLFVDFERPRRVRVSGTARVHTAHPRLAEWPGGQALIEVAVERIFPNCPRYIHRMTLVEHSPYAPREGATPPVPDWKNDPRFADAVKKR